nr:hypothetical protein [Tanacetum cinerariifolium]
MESIFMTGSSSVTPIPSPKSTMTPSIITTTTTTSQPPISPTPIPSDILQTLSTFASVFRFEDRVKSLEVNFSEFMRTHQSPEAVSNIPDEQRNLYKALVEAYDADKTILDSYGESAILKRRRKDDDDQEGPSTGSDRGSKRRREGGEHASASTSSEPAIGNTPIDFSNFIMNRLGLDTLTPELLASPTYELIRGSCNSLTELEYYLEEVYKATTDQLDWVHPEGQQYPHNLLQPLPLIPDN